MIPDIAGDIAALRRRLDQLERSTMAPVIEQRDTDGSVMIRVGKQPDGTWGVWVAADDGHLAPSDPVGRVEWFVVNPPSGWVQASGQPITAIMFPALRSTLLAAGAPWGMAGSDPRVPDLRGRVLVHADPGNPRMGHGATGGSETMTIDAMPSHTHTQAPHSHEVVLSSNPGENLWATVTPGEGVVANASQKVPSTWMQDEWVTGAVTATNHPAGGGAPGGNMPPYMALRAYIRAY